MYCGIDVAKGKSAVCILDSNKQIVEEFEITHTKDGFEKLEKQLTKEAKIGMEVTSNYSTALYSFLKERYNVCYVDSKKLKNFISLNNAHIKNDEADAKAIAQYLTFGFKEIRTSKENELKDLVRLYSKTIRELTRYKIMFTSQLAVIFPELEENFYITKGRGILYMLLKYPNPKAIAQATDEEIHKALTEKLIKSKRTIVYAKRLRQVAKDSVGVPDYPVSCFKFTVKILLYYQDLVDEIVKSMEERLNETPYAPLLNEYGYQIRNLSIIVGEVGDIRKFANHKKFVKYVGLDVSENRSGSSVSLNCYITRQGNKYLRSIFYNMVLNHLAYKTKYSEFYYRLKNAGKHPKKAMAATARKLVIRTYNDMLKCHDS